MDKIYTLIIGLAVHDITNPYFSEVCAAIESILSQNGRMSFLCNSNESLERQTGIDHSKYLRKCKKLVILVALFNGLLVAVVKIQPIVATLILMVTGRGMAMLFTGGYVLNYDHPTFMSLGVGDWLGLPIPIYIAIFILIILSVLATRTPLGLLIQSTGGNETASRYSGTNTALVRILVYVIAGICAGVAGIIFTADVQSADAAFIGLWIELEAILAVVIGGTLLNCYH